MNKIESFKCLKCGWKIFYVDIILHKISILDALLTRYVPRDINFICIKCGSSYNPLKESK